MPVAAALAFVPLWLIAPLSIGEVSLAFGVPFALAAWALSRPPSGRGLAYALQGEKGHGLWIEASVIAVAIVFALLSMVNSPEPERGFRVLLPMSYGLCAMVLMGRVVPHLARQALYALLLSGLAVLAIGLVLARLPGIRDVVMQYPGYRYRGFFENANQLALAVVAFFPLAVAGFCNARTSREKLAWVIALLVLIYALTLSGTKTGMAVCIATGALVCLYHAARSGSLGRTILSLCYAVALIGIGLTVGAWILSWASPIAFEKVNTILAEGVADYQSIRSRNLLWDESIRLGLSSPLVGVGAGTKIMGRSHSHNMVIDYFRGMGIFGMAAAVLLYVAVAARALRFFLSTLGKGREDKNFDTNIAALYLGALGFVTGNQISDSFSPSVGFLFWAVYICAYVSAHERTVEPRASYVVPSRFWTVRGAGAVDSAPARGGTMHRQEQS